MPNEIQAFHQQVNHARFRGQAVGHYESFFLRANHPTRPLAFWIRYTIFSPRGDPGNAVGELWAVFFDGETNRHVVAKQEYPLADCLFDASTFRVRVGTATLGPHRLIGSVESRGQTLAWDLAFEGESAPILLLPFKLYQGGFPAAKSLVSLPLVLRHGQREYALTGLVQGLKAHGAFGYFNWEFRSETDEVEIEGVISAPREAFVGLAYRNPPGAVPHSRY